MQNYYSYLQADCDTGKSSFHYDLFDGWSKTKTIKPQKIKKTAPTRGVTDWYKDCFAIKMDFLCHTKEQSRKPIISLKEIDHIWSSQHRAIMQDEIMIYILWRSNDTFNTLSAKYKESDELLKFINFLTEKEKIRDNDLVSLILEMKPFFRDHDLLNFFDNRVLSLNAADYKIELLLCILRNSYPFRKKLSNWHDFLDATSNKLKESHLDEKRVLLGLI